MHLTVAKKKKVHVEFTVLFFGNSEWYQTVFSVAKIFNLFCFLSFFPHLLLCHDLLFSFKVFRKERFLTYRKTLTQTLFSSSKRVIWWKPIGMSNTPSACFASGLSDPYVTGLVILRAGAPGGRSRGPNFKW